MHSPGLNIAANYGFLSRDGLPTFDELVAAQQNMYNVSAVSYRLSYRANDITISSATISPWFWLLRPLA